VYINCNLLTVYKYIAAADSLVFIKSCYCSIFALNLRRLGTNITGLHTPKVDFQVWNTASAGVNTRIQF